jgi:hypothetical protein
MIRLHQYPPMFGLPNPSPFCMKLETWLRNFFGQKPTEIDATAYGFLAQVLWAPGSRRMREHMEQTRNLPAFCTRMRQTFYGGNQS